MQTTQQLKYFMEWEVWLPPVDSTAAFVKYLSVRAVHKILATMHVNSRHSYWFTTVWQSEKTWVVAIRIFRLQSHKAITDQLYQVLSSIFTKTTFLIELINIKQSFLMKNCIFLSQNSKIYWVIVKNKLQLQLLDNGYQHKLIMLFASIPEL